MRATEARTTGKRAAPADIDREEVRRLTEAGAQLLEVLSHHQYEEEHLPGAVSLPLADFSRETLSGLDRARPVIVYCWDHQ